jgi:SAM-dependent methyltransferase
VRTLVQQTADRSYRTLFQHRESASNYELNYSRLNYDSILWNIEKSILLDVIKRSSQNERSSIYLDFATGTGRILTFLEDHMQAADGIDISESMVALARSKTSKARLFVGDATSDDCGLRDKYDVITAFRFFLNAEPEIRHSVMNALARRLRTRESLLIFNNHGNPYSHKALMWPYHRLRRLGRGRPTSGNYMSHREVLRLVEGAGLEIVEDHGYGLLSGKARWIASDARLEACERRLAGTRLARCGACRMYVARPRGTG